MWKYLGDHLADPHFYPCIREADLVRWLVLVPSSSEQIRIVSYLDDLRVKVDAVRKMQEETSEELDALMPSILSRAFSGELSAPTFMSLSIEQLGQITDSADFDLLISEVENDWFDCKSQPYQLQDNQAAKRELAKDVSSFANETGGYIFIGVKTKPVRPILGTK